MDCDKDGIYELALSLCITVSGIITNTLSLSFFLSSRLTLSSFGKLNILSPSSRLTLFSSAKLNMVSLSFFLLSRLTLYTSGKLNVVSVQGAGF